MALEAGLEEISYPANADLSGYQNRIVKTVTGGKVDLAAGSVDAITGILGNKPGSAGAAAAVGISGKGRAIAGGVVAAGDLLTSDANGLAIATTTTGNRILGRAITAGGSGQYIEVQIAPHVL